METSSTPGICSCDDVHWLLSEYSSTVLYCIKVLSRGRRCLCHCNPLVVSWHKLEKPGSVELKTWVKTIKMSWSTLMDTNWANCTYCGLSWPTSPTIRIPLWPWHIAQNCPKPLLLFSVQSSNLVLVLRDASVNKIGCFLETFQMGKGRGRGGHLRFQKIVLQMFAFLLRKQNCNMIYQM